jgi:PAS domain-containing protein
VGKSEGTILDAIPSPIFIVDHDVRIIWVNRAAAMMLPEEPKMVIRRVAGDILHCVHSTEVRQG